MKQKNLASAITIVFSTIVAFPTVSQAAVEQSNLAQVCRTENDMRAWFGLPVVKCAGAEKTSGVETGQAGTADSRAEEKQSSRAQVCRTENDMRAWYGLPVVKCAG